MLLSSLVLIRFVNMLISFIAGMLSVYLAVPEKFHLATALVVGITASLTAGFGNVINDIADIEIDRINKPERPLPSRRISIPQAKFLALLLCGGAILTGLLYLQIGPITVLLFSNFVIAMYSLFLKQIPLAGNAVVAFFTGLVFIYGGMAAGNLAAGFIPAGFAFLSNFIREIVKTAEDVVGDSARGVLTFPGKYGTENTKRLVRVLSMVLLLATFLPFLTQWYRIEYFIIAMTMVNPLLVLVIRNVGKCSNDNDWHAVSTLLKLVMISGLIAIAAGV